MLSIIRPTTPKYVSFASPTEVFISSHKTMDGITRFLYQIPIDVDTKQSESLTGDLQIRVFSSQGRQPVVRIKKSDATSQNLIKKIDQQKLLNSVNSGTRKKYILKKYIDRSDLAQSKLQIELEIPDSALNGRFSVEIINIQDTRFSVLIDSLDLDHESYLSKYDLPTDNFNLTVIEQGNRSVVAAATTYDENIGSFNFFLKKDSTSDFLPTYFSTTANSSVDLLGVATTVFDIGDNGIKYSIRACPVSRFQNKTVGNFKEMNSSFTLSSKMIPFYVSGLTDKEVTFQVTSIDTSVKKIMLYRQLSTDPNREFIDYAENTGNSAVLTDSGRKPQYDYLYSVDYIDKDGVLHTSPSEVIVLSLKLDNLAKLSVSLVSNVTGSTQLISTSNQITFDAKVQYDTSTLYDDIVSDVKSLGIESILSTDLEKMTNNLKPITRVLVSRISMRTGLESMYGVFPPGQITVNNSDADPCLFRFEVAVRSVPESLEMMTSAQNVIADNAYNLKSSVDLASKVIGNRAKSSRTSFSAKFFTRSSIRGSTLKYGDATDLFDISYYSGRTGIFQDVSIPGIRVSSKIVSRISTVRSVRGNFIKWNVSGGTSDIEYFEILIDGERFKCHPVASPAQMFFIGDRIPSKVTITPVVAGQISESGSATIGA